jgi:hypothetical protein
MDILNIYDLNSFIATFDLFILSNAYETFAYEPIPKRDST